METDGPSAKHGWVGSQDRDIYNELAIAGTSQLARYPGYSGGLSVTGTVGAYLDKNNNAHIWYEMAGLEEDCDTNQGDSGVANACGIHIHEGKTCDDPSLVGGHYYAGSDSGESDPWSDVTYVTSEDKQHQRDSSNVRFSLWKSKGEKSVGIGADQDVNGRAIVVHDKTGARVACAVINNTPKDEEVHLKMCNTTHRGENENRCTSHLDLCFQPIPCAIPCKPPTRACTDEWIEWNYGQHGFLNTTVIDGFDRHTICYPTYAATTELREHTLEWAHNLCDCTECVALHPKPDATAIPPGTDDYCPEEATTVPPTTQEATTTMPVTRATTTPKPVTRATTTDRKSVV